MSRQPTPTWRVLAKTHLRGRLLSKHAHTSDQLLFAASGVMQVRTGHGQWTVPPKRALWIPAGVQHAVIALSDTEMRTVYFSRGNAASKNQHVHAVVPSALLGELILGLFDRNHGVSTRQAMVDLLLQLVPKAQEPQYCLPFPSHPLLLDATTWLMSQRQWDLSLAAAAAKVGMSARSFTRHFSAEVGCSFRQWRQRARIVGSLDRLVSGDSIKLIANQAGFASSSAYIVAFKTITGDTPAQFAAQV